MSEKYAEDYADYLLGEGRKPGTSATGTMGRDPTTGVTNTMVLSDGTVVEKKEAKGETMGGIYGNTPVYEPLAIGAEMRAGASLGSKVPDSTNSLPFADPTSKGMKGKVMGADGLPKGVPNSAASGLAGPQSAEVAAAAAAKISLQPPKRVVVATKEALSGVTYGFETPGLVSDADKKKIQTEIAKKCGLNETDIRLEVTVGKEGDGSSARRRRRRLSGNGQTSSVKAYVVSGDAMAALANMQSLDSSALASSVGIPIEGVVSPQLLQVSADGTAPKAPHPRARCMIASSHLTADSTGRLWMTAGRVGRLGAHIPPVARCLLSAV